MSYRPTLDEIAPSAQAPLLAARQVTTHPLADEHEAEVLAFLAEYPIRTVVMAGFIADNGMESPFNRGTFYACRDHEGKLEGVALIGHATFVEARTEAALKAFAGLAQDCSHAHVIVGEKETVARFWSYYSPGGQPARLFCRELLFEQSWPVASRAPVLGLRLATQEDLPLVMPVHAALAYEESGINPLDVDPQGFRLRCARRIEHKRVWVWVEENRLIFKADIIAETPEAIYLEGVYVNEQERGKGYGLRCMSQLGRHLLARSQAVTVLVNERQSDALDFYRQAGFKLRGVCDTIYLRQNNA